MRNPIEVRQCPQGLELVMYVDTDQGEMIHLELLTIQEAESLADTLNNLAQDLRIVQNEQQA